ncbi:MAG: ferric reductase-like transmembrane domain-containing protein [Sphaerochaetaceae bacterium]|nr:ferric reductase-like transmembrane domain-containing protein [Sphaerochaetaceae bacterium]
MESKKRIQYLLPGAVIYLAIPLIYMIVGDFQSRTILKEIISLATVGAFFILLGQFYLSRANIVNIKGHKFSKVINLHKVLGYIAIPIIFIHPLLIILPRYFEASIDLKDAFTLIITNFGSKGIILGIIAMVIMLLIGLLSIFRKHLKIKYTTWRYIHGYLSLAFIILATWHVVDLGRHMDTFLSTYTIIMASIGIVFLIRLYFFNQSRRRNK